MNLTLPFESWLCVTSSEKGGIADFFLTSGFLLMPEIFV